MVGTDHIRPFVYSRRMKDSQNIRWLSRSPVSDRSTLEWVTFCVGMSEAARGSGINPWRLWGEVDNSGIHPFDSCALLSILCSLAVGEHGLRIVVEEKQWFRSKHCSFYGYPRCENQIVSCLLRFDLMQSLMPVAWLILSALSTDNLLISNSSTKWPRCECFKSLSLFLAMAMLKAGFYW